MKKNRSLLCIFVIVILAFSTLFVACNSTQAVQIGVGNNARLISEPEEISVDFEELLSFTTLLDDSYIYLSIDGSTATYYRSYFNGETVMLGNVHNFYLSMKQSALIDTKLYFYVSVYDDVLVDTLNSLICIDLSTNTLEQYEHYDGSIAGITTYEFCNNIATLKNNVNEESITTFIEIFNTETTEWESYLVNSIDTGTNQGTAIFSLCADDDTLYVLYDERSQGEGIDTYLKLYDKDFTETKSIKISEEVHDYVMTSQITDMQVFGNYIYIYNASNYGFLGQIVDGNLVEILKERNLELSACNSNSTEVLFYLRRSNTFYLLNISEGTLKDYQFQIHSDYSIMTMLSTNENVFVVCYADDKPNHAYMLNKESLADAILPCE